MENRNKNQRDSYISNDRPCTYWLHVIFSTLIENLLLNFFVHALLLHNYVLFFFGQLVSFHLSLFFRVQKLVYLQHQLLIGFNATQKFLIILLLLLLGLVLVFDAVLCFLCLAWVMTDVRKLTLSRNSSLPPYSWKYSPAAWSISRNSYYILAM